MGEGVVYKQESAWSEYLEVKLTWAEMLNKWITTVKCRFLQKNM
jgi:hypothetical protein